MLSITSRGTNRQTDEDDDEPGDSYDGDDDEPEDGHGDRKRKGRGGKRRKKKRAGVLCTLRALWPTHRPANSCNTARRSFSSPVFLPALFILRFPGLARLPPPPASSVNALCAATPLQGLVWAVKIGPGLGCVPERNVPVYLAALNVQVCT